MDIEFNHETRRFAASVAGATGTGESLMEAVSALRGAYTGDWEALDEAYRIKVNFKGKKTRKLKCPKGMKVNASRTACVPMTGGERSTQRVAKRKMVRTVKAGGAMLQRRKKIKTKRALRFRKMYHV